jgi:hypothetical protein
MAFGAIVMDTKEVEALQKGLASLPEAIPKVTSFAINYAVDKAKTNAWRAIGARYNIQQQRVYDALTLLKSTPTNLSGGIVANSPHFKLGYFKVTPPNPQPAKRPLISVAVTKGGSKPVKGAFVAVMKSGHKGIFERVPGAFMKPKMGKRGKPLAPKQQIREQYTIGVAEMMEQKTVIEQIDKAAHDAFEYEFGRQADRALGQSLGKAT